MWRTGISFRAATAFFPQGQWEEFLCFPQPAVGGFSREILHRISFHIPQPLWKEKSVKKMLHFDDTACRRCHVPPAWVFLVLTRNTRKKQPEGDCVVAFPRAKAIAPSGHPSARAPACLYSVSVRWRTFCVYVVLERRQWSTPWLPLWGAVTEGDGEGITLPSPSTLTRGHFSPRERQEGAVVMAAALRA